MLEGFKSFGVKLVKIPDFHYYLSLHLEISGQMGCCVVQPNMLARPPVCY